MKQELESEIALEIQSLNKGDEVVPSPSSEIDVGSDSELMSSLHVCENPGGIVKSSVVNGHLVYTRTKKSRHLRNGSSENGSLKRLKTSEDREPNADLPVVGGGDDVELNNVEKNIESEVVCHLEKPVRCTELKNEPVQFLAGEGGCNKVPAEPFNSEAQKNVDKTVKRFTRSALKPKVECSDETRTAPEAARTENNRSVEKETAALSASTTRRNKLELKMSKKIVLSKKPTTVKELFDTGLLDGVSVVYMGGKVSF